MIKQNKANPLSTKVTKQIRLERPKGKTLMFSWGEYYKFEDFFGTNHGIPASGTPYCTGIPIKKNILVKFSSLWFVIGSRT